MWFIAPAKVVLLADDGGTDRLEFRISGVLRETVDGWLFELFNGTQPVVPVPVS